MLLWCRIFLNVYAERTASSVPHVLETTRWGGKRRTCIRLTYFNQSTGEEIPSHESCNDEKEYALDIRALEEKETFFFICALLLHGRMWMKKSEKSEQWRFRKEDIGVDWVKWRMLLTNEHMRPTSWAYFIIEDNNSFDKKRVTTGKAAGIEKTPKWVSLAA